MADLQTGWGGDVASTETGDLATVSGPALGTQRVLRRLLTNPGDYIWQPEYGAGLGQFVGQPADTAAIQTLIRTQMRLEPAVAASPEPVISLQLDPGGSLSVQIRYADAETAETQSLSINLPR